MLGARPREQLLREGAGFDETARRAGEGHRMQELFGGGGRQRAFAARSIAEPAERERTVVGPLRFERPDGALDEAQRELAIGNRQTPEGMLRRRDQPVAAVRRVEGGGRACVKRGPLARCHRFVERIADQDVAEAKLPRLELQHHAGAQRRNQLVDRARRQAVHDLGHQRRREVSPENGAGPERPLRSFGQKPRPLEHHLAHGRGQAAERAKVTGRGGEGAGVLHDEEWIAPRELLEPCHRRLGQARFGDARGELLDELRGKRLKTHVETVAEKPGQPVARAIVEPRIFGARGGDDQAAKRLEWLDEEDQQIESLQIGGVHVLDDEERRRFAALSGQPLEHALPQQERTFFSRRLERLGIDVERAQCRAQGEPGRRVGELPGAARGDPEPAPLGAFSEHLHERALADARLARHEGETPPPRRRRVEGLRERVELLRASDQRRSLGRRTLSHALASLPVLALRGRQP